MLMNLSKDQASLRIDRRSGKHLVYDVTVKCTNANTRDEKWSAATTRRALARGRLSGAAVAPKRTETGRRSCADAVSIGPSALDRKSGAAHGSVRSHSFARSLCGELRRWQLAPKPVSQADLTPFGRRCGRHPSLGVAAQRSL
jgi:hypothetical protein